MRTVRERTGACARKLNHILPKSSAPIRLVTIWRLPTCVCSWLVGWVGRARWCRCCCAQAWRKGCRHRQRVLRAALAFIAHSDGCMRASQCQGGAPLQWGGSGTAYLSGLSGYSAAFFFPSSSAKGNAASCQSVQSAMPRACDLACICLICWRLGLWLTGGMRRVCLSQCITQRASGLPHIMQFAGVWAGGFHKVLMRSTISDANSTKALLPLALGSNTTPGNA